METFLGVKRTPISLEEIWQRSKPVKTALSLEKYFSNVFGWVANIDQWNGFFKDFLHDYKSTFGRAPVLNPQLQFKRYAGDCPTSKENQDKGLELLHTFRSWYEENVIPASTNGCTDTIPVLPWSDGEPDYRDTYRKSAQKFTGVGFFFYNISPYAGAPEIIIPGKHCPPTTIKGLKLTLLAGETS